MRICASHNGIVSDPGCAVYLRFYGNCETSLSTDRTPCEHGFLTQSDHCIAHMFFCFLCNSELRHEQTLARLTRGGAVVGTRCSCPRHLYVYPPLQKKHIIESTYLDGLRKCPIFACSLRRAHHQTWIPVKSSMPA
jgi:hypothetical protein